MAFNTHGSFISEKPNKIRWRPDPFNNANSFVTGSWDNDQNNIKLWNFSESEEDVDVEPFVVSNYPFNGDVTELKFLSPDHFVTSSSSGSVYLLKVNVQDKGAVNITENISWPNLHYFANQEASSCTSLAIYDNDICTIGEDGRINVLTAKRNDIIKKIDNADSCSLNCITFLKYSEILTGNNRGLMKIWDLRSNETSPSNSFMLSEDPVAATCIAFHPTQRHMVIAGDEEGSLTIWDLRQNTFPINLLSAHTESITEIMFHPDNPEQLFSASAAGEFWHWTTNTVAKSSKHVDVGENPWFTEENIKNKVEVFTLMPKLHKPINSLDLNRNRALCGCDNEAVYFISNLNVYN